MSDTFQSLLSSIGFPSADAANQAGQIERKLELGKSNIGLAGEDQRRQMAAGFEGRGVTLSGEANQAYARQRGQEANQLAGLDIAGADSLFGLQRDLAQQQAQKDAQDQARSLSTDLFNQQMNQQNAQLTTLQQQNDPTALNAALQALIQKILGGG